MNGIIKYGRQHLFGILPQVPRGLGPALSIYRRCLELLQGYKDALVIFQINTYCKYSPNSRSLQSCPPPKKNPNKATWGGESIMLCFLGNLRIKREAEKSYSKESISILLERNLLF